MGQKTFLLLKNISKTFPGVKALSSVELEVFEGEVHALVGENGAGKSTLIKILAGVEQPDSDEEILIEGNPVHIERPIDSTRKGIAVIYQDLSLFPNLSVAENIGFGIEIMQGKKYINWPVIRETARRTLSELGLDVDINLPLEKLSIAKQQMVAIARSLVFNAKMIIMDEPTSSLSGGEVEHLFRIIRSLKKKGISILFISHKMQEIFSIADRITVLRDGKYMGTYLKDDISEEKLITLMVGRKIHYVNNSQTINNSQMKSRPVALDVRSISKQGNFKDISFKLHEGEILSLTGLVGSGRTEVATAIFGLNRPDSGEIMINGQKVNISSPMKAMQYGIAYIPESRQQQGLIIKQSTGSNLVLTILKKIRNKLSLIDNKKEKSAVCESIKTLDIRPPNPEMLAMNLSGGNQQKVVIAKWLATRPKILIIDEPTNGIDIGAKSEVHKLLQELANSGMSILMISSELPEVLAISNRILVMRGGRIVSEFKAEEATQEKILNMALFGELRVEKMVEAAISIGEEIQNEKFS